MTKPTPGHPMITSAPPRLAWADSLRKHFPKAVAFLLATAHAAPPPPTPIHWQATAPTHARPGARLDLQLTAKIDPGWHLYTLTEPEDGPTPTEINLTEGDPATLLRTVQSKPRTLQDHVFGKPVTLFESSATFTLHLQLAPTLPAGPHPLHILIRYQSCDDRVCLPPHTDTVEVPL